MDSNREDGFVFQQPKTLDRRRELASVLVHRLGYRMPVAIDPIENPAGTAFAAWPERIYIVGADGRVAYKGGMGPFGFDPAEAETALKGLLGTSRPPANVPTRCPTCS
jgi:hypothetical protein